MDHSELAALTRLPSSWEAISNLCDYHDLYRSLAAEAPPGSLIVEVGSYLGHGACFLAAHARELGKPLRVVALDRCTGSDPATDGAGWGLAKALGGSFAGILCRNVAALGLDDLITVMIQDSARAASLFADGSCHAVFLDASHDRESVERDIRAWLPKVMRGGILAGHDLTHPAFPGVRQALDVVLEDRWGSDPRWPSCWSVRV
jgi:predicted O-methyltransferase YrrM